MENIIKALENIINLAEKMKNAYFWKSPGSAGMRRSYEKQNSAEKIEWTENGHVYTAEYITTCSCKNIYAHGEYTRDGKKTTLTAIKNSLERLKAAA